MTINNAIQSRSGPSGFAPMSSSSKAKVQTSSLLDDLNKIAKIDDKTQAKASTKIDDETLLNMFKQSNQKAYSQLSSNDLFSLMQHNNSMQTASNNNQSSLMNKILSAYENNTSATNSTNITI